MNIPINQETGKWKQRAQRQIYSGPWAFEWGKRELFSHSPVRYEKPRGQVKTQTGNHQARKDRRHTLQLLKA